MYIQGIEKLNIFIKKGTNDVPNDKKYHVINDGKIIGSYKTLDKALDLYKKYIPKMKEKSKKKILVEDLKKYDFRDKFSLGMAIQNIKKKKSGRYHKIK